MEKPRPSFRWPRFSFMQGRGLKSAAQRLQGSRCSHRPYIGDTGLSAGQQKEEEKDDSQKRVDSPMDAETKKAKRRGGFGTVFFSGRAGRKGTGGGARRALPGSHRGDDGARPGLLPAPASGAALFCAGSGWKISAGAVGSPFSGWVVLCGRPAVVQL
jgi:hypothetical protein